MPYKRGKVDITQYFGQKCLRCPRILAILDSERSNTVNSHLAKILLQDIQPSADTPVNVEVFRHCDGPDKQSILPAGCGATEHIVFVTGNEVIDSA